MNDSPPALNCDISGPFPSSLILNLRPSRSAGSASPGIWMSQSSSPPAAGAVGSVASSTTGLIPAGTYSSPGSNSPGPLIAFVRGRTEFVVRVPPVRSRRAAVEELMLSGADWEIDAWMKTFVCLRVSPMR